MKNALIITAFILATFICLFGDRFGQGLVTKDKCKHVSGTVTGIFDDGNKDAIFKIEGQKSLFYLNQGFEKKLNLKNLLEKVQGKQVNILYADHWNPLGSISESRHISEISVNEELLYSEFPSNK